MNCILVYLTLVCTPIVPPPVPVAEAPYPPPVNVPTLSDYGDRQVQRCYAWERCSSR